MSFGLWPTILVCLSLRLWDLAFPLFFIKEILRWCCEKFSFRTTSHLFLWNEWCLWDCRRPARGQICHVATWGYHSYSGIGSVRETNPIQKMSHTLIGIIADTFHLTILAYTMNSLYFPTLLLLFSFIPNPKRE